MSTYPDRLKPTCGEIVTAHDHSRAIIEIVQAQTREKLYNPRLDELATARLKHTVDRWKDEGKTVVLVFGGFDAPFHPDHQAYLLDCKSQGVAMHYRKHHESIVGKRWEELDPSEQQAYIAGAIADGEVKLVVSTDGDERIAGSKGNNPLKGGSVRPLQGWETRAHNLAHFSLNMSPGANHHSPIVDAVTIHDHLALPDTAHQSPHDLAALLQPDVWTLYHEAEDDIAQASQDPRLNNIQTTVIYGRGYSKVDPLTDEPFSTTALVRRIRGEA